MPSTGSLSTTKDRKFNTYFTCGNVVNLLHVSAFFGHPQGGFQQREIPQWLVMVSVTSVFIYAFVIVSNVCLLNFSLSTYLRMAETCSRIITYLYIIVPNYSAVVLVMCNVILAPSWPDPGRNLSSGQTETRDLRRSPFFRWDIPVVLLGSQV